MSIVNFSNSCYNGYEGLAHLDNYTTGNKRKEVILIKSALPLIDFIQDWLLNKKVYEVKEGTYKRLQISANALGKFDIARIPVKDVTVEDFQEYISQLLAYGYARGTIKKMMEIVSAPLQFAYVQRYIDFNPSVGVKLPAKARVLKKDKEIVAYTPEEQECLRSVLATHRNDAYYAIELMLETGMRVGEVLALDWEDVNLSARPYIWVHKTVINPFNKGKSKIQDSAKSESSNRKVPLSKKAVALLRELHRKSNNDYLFSCATNSRLGYQTLMKHCRKICDKAGVEYHGLHVWRHTFATNQYYKGTDVAVLSRILGHSKPSITYNIYIHLYGDGFDDMLAAVN